MSEIVVSSGIFVPLFAMMVIIISLACVYETPFYYFKLFCWELGFLLLGSMIGGGTPGFAVFGLVLALACLFLAAPPPVLYVTMFFGGLGALILGRGL